MFKNYQQYMNYRNNKSQQNQNTALQKNSNYSQKTSALSVHGLCSQKASELSVHGLCSQKTSEQYVKFNNCGTQNCCHCPHVKSAVPPLKPFVPPIDVPPSEPFDTENFHGSIQQVLFENVGKCVNCEFLVGTAITTTKSGIIYYVGRSYLILFAPNEAEYVLCDIFSVKFVTFVTLDNCIK